MLLRIDQLFKTYPGTDGETTVLRGISLDVDAGETVALTGESGSGKSTLIHLVAGLDAPDAGTVQIGEQQVSGANDRQRADLRRDKIGLIFQQFNLIPSLSVAANLSFQARLANRYDPEWVDTMSERLALVPLLTKYPETLSGGQQQRVAVGRALASRPPLILADEPTGNLDRDTGDAVLDLMLDLVSDTGAALILVTHSDRLAGRLGRRLHLSDGTLA
ncbi:MAG: ABC transporter ATP-binding protein [Pseudomonadota bacterium]